MDVSVGLSTNDLLSRLHGSVTVECSAGLEMILEIHSGVSNQAQLSRVPVKITPVAPGKTVTVRATGNSLSVSEEAVSQTASVQFRPGKPGADIVVTSLKRSGVSPKYRGALRLLPVDSKVRLILNTDLDTYVKGVLRSEMPDSYHLEAIKAQAVCARTYGLHPRLSHEDEGFNVCDSYLHCQAFSGTTFGITPKEEQAITQTRSQILTYEGKPALALFSANAGGHTESYENCFSDPVTNAFPPPAIPYLKGVPEGALPASFPSEEGLRALWVEQSPHTADAWSSEFRWKLALTERDYEGHMHYVVQDMMKDPQFAPFIKPPPGEKFGHINSFEITQRGVSGVAISMIVKTSAGDWIINKELTIRSIFKNPELKVPRLHSARVFMDQQRDHLGLLSQVTVFGLGFGHGVGLQQTGAEGWARQGKTYRQILEHYYPGIEIG